MRGEPSPFFSSSKYEPVPGLPTSQSPGTSNCVPHLGLVTTFQPGMRGLGSPSSPRGFASAEEADPDGLTGADDCLPSAESLPLSSLFITTTPVTAAATTTAVAATMATAVVFFLLLSPGCGAPGGPGTAYCGTVGCWYAFGCA